MFGVLSGRERIACFEAAHDFKGDCVGRPVVEAEGDQLRVVEAIYQPDRVVAIRARSSRDVVGRPAELIFASRLNRA